MNKTAQFTPGPWYAANMGNDFQGLVVEEQTGKNIAVAYDKRDVHILAAAPAMYEALAKLRLEAIHYRNTGVGKQFLNEAIAQAEQAINQVWGEGNHDTKREG